jgi:hypothetical protein
VGHGTLPDSKASLNSTRFLGFLFRQDAHLARRWIVTLLFLPPPCRGNGPERVCLELMHRTNELGPLTRLSAVTASSAIAGTLHRMDRPCCRQMKSRHFGEMWRRALQMSAF